MRIWGSNINGRCSISLLRWLIRLHLSHKSQNGSIPCFSIEIMIHWVILMLTLLNSIYLSKQLNYLQRRFTTAQRVIDTKTTVSLYLVHQSLQRLWTRPIRSRVSKLAGTSSQMLTHVETRVCMKPHSLPCPLTTTIPHRDFRLGCMWIPRSVCPTEVGGV